MDSMDDTRGLARQLNQITDISVKSQEELDSPVSESPMETIENRFRDRIENLTVEIEQ